MIEETQLKASVIGKQGDDATYDIVIIGAGPAGMSAALCAARADYNVLLVDKALPGGESATAYRIDNYLGFPDGILGEDLVAQMEAHIRNHDIDFVCAKVDDIQQVDQPVKVLVTDLGSIYRTKTIILALGLEPKAMNRPFERKFMGRGISYYAQCDASSYEGQAVAVIGGGNCACYAADFLSNYVSELYLIHRLDSIKAVKQLRERVLTHPVVQPIWDSEVVDVFGLEKVEKIKICHRVTGQHTWLDVKCVFVYEGRVPSQDILFVGLNVDEDGYIITDDYMRTNVPGVYAAGDARSKQIRQIATAVSDGMIASINAGRDIEAMLR